MARIRVAVCLLGVAALIASCGQDYHASSGIESSDPLYLTPGTSDTVFLMYGETVVVEPEVLSITFDSVIQDSRCPSTVECFWEGVAIIQLQLVTASPTVTTIVLASHDNIPIEVGTVVDTLGDRFELLNIDPYPVTIDPIPLPEYVATLLISTTQPAAPTVPETGITRRPSKTHPTTLPQGERPINQ